MVHRCQQVPTKERCTHHGDRWALLAVVWWWALFKQCMRHEQRIFTWCQWKLHWFADKYLFFPQCWVSRFQPCHLPLFLMSFQLFFMTEILLCMSFQRLYLWNALLFFSKRHCCVYFLKYINDIKYATLTLSEILESEEWDSPWLIKNLYFYIFSLWQKRVVCYIKFQSFILLLIFESFFIIWIICILISLGTSTVYCSLLQDIL